MTRARTSILATTAIVALLMSGCSSKKSSSAATVTTSGGVSVTTAAATGTTVQVAVGDKSGLSGPMTLTASPAAVPAGDVTFVVKNTGTVDHEVIVLKAGPFDKLAVVDGGDPPAAVTTGADKVDEGTKAGETGDPNLKPGQSRSFTLKLAAGQYSLVCNLAKHYGLGMRAALTVG